MKLASFLKRPRRLARPRTSPFHGGNTGSNPVGDAKSFQALAGNRRNFPRHKKAQLLQKCDAVDPVIDNVFAHFGRFFIGTKRHSVTWAYQPAAAPDARNSLITSL